MQPNDRERHDSNLTKEESLRVGLVDRALMAQVTLLSGIATGLGWWLQVFFGGREGKKGSF